MRHCQNDRVRRRRNSMEIENSETIASRKAPRTSPGGGRLKKKEKKKSREWNSDENAAAMKSR